MSFALPPLKDVIERYGLRTKKSLGQHFLLDSNLTDKIARLAGDISQTSVIEVGPGPGGLTRSLLAAGAHELLAVEKDERCIPALEELQSHASGRLRIIKGDAGEVAMHQLGQAPRCIVSNLPYNVGTELLLGWLGDIRKDASAYTSLTLMFQKEVAERIAAVPSTKAYGRISILAQWLCDVRPLMKVPAASFSPPPKVDSAVIQLVPRDKPLCDADKRSIEKVVAIAFQQRRKMLRSALKPLGKALLEALEADGFDTSLRPDQLTIEQYCQIANRWDDTKSQ